MVCLYILALFLCKSLKKVAAVAPRDKLWVDTIGPYTVKTVQNRSRNTNKKRVSKNKDDRLKLWCLTMVDPVTEDASR